MTKLTDTQHGVLHTLAEFGPKTGFEVLGPAGMDGKRTVKLECLLMNAATLAKLEGAGFVSVARDPVSRPKDATGRKGHPRRSVTISITDAGRSALASA